jgi:hypothetical protein
VVSRTGLVEDVTITGSHFVPGSTSVRLLLSEHIPLLIPASEVAVAPDGNSLTFDVDVSGADAGTRNVFVSVTGVNCPAGQLPGAFTISECYLPFADLDGDDDVDQIDFSELQRCFTGAEGGVPAGCSCFNRDDDNDVDVDDFEAFQNCATAPGVLWTQGLTPGCVP